MPEGTDVIHPITEVTKMSLAVYRGVAYDTDRKVRQEAVYVKIAEMYRGVEHTETVKVEVPSK